jgi:hypothetical protein
MKAQSWPAAERSRPSPHRREQRNEDRHQDQNGAYAQQEDRGGEQDGRGGERDGRWKREGESGEVSAAGRQSFGPITLGMAWIPLHVAHRARAVHQFPVGAFELLPRRLGHDFSRLVRDIDVVVAAARR